MFRGVLEVGDGSKKNNGQKKQQSTKKRKQRKGTTNKMTTLLWIFPLFSSIVFPGINSIHNYCCGDFALFSQL